MFSDVISLPMVSKPAVGGVLFVILFIGCSDHEAVERRARAEADAKARAEAARSEMEALPKAFETPDYFKKNQPSKKANPAPAPKQTSI